jgi:hypothetical protein
MAVRLPCFTVYVNVVTMLKWFSHKVCSKPLHFKQNDVIYFILLTDYVGWLMYIRKKKINFKVIGLKALKKFRLLDMI